MGNFQLGSFLAAVLGLGTMSAHKDRELLRGPDDQPPRAVADAGAGLSRFARPTPTRPSYFNRILRTRDDEPERRSGNKMTKRLKAGKRLFRV